MVFTILKDVVIVVFIFGIIYGGSASFGGAWQRSLLRGGWGDDGGEQGILVGA